MNVEIVKKLGSGFEGTVYLAKVNKKISIFKIEKLNGVSFMQYHRQVYFNNTFAINYPDKFMTLKSHGIIKDCDHIQSIPGWTNEEQKKFLEWKNSLEECSFLIYTPRLSYTLKKLLPKLSNKSYLNMLYQVIDTINLLRNNDIIHRDVSSDNIMCNSKKDKWYIIDYGRITSKDHDITKFDEDIDKYFSNDLLMFIGSIVNNPMFYEVDDFPDDKKAIKIIKKDKIFLKIKKYLPKKDRRINNLRNKNIQNKSILIILAIIDYQLYCKLYLDVDYTKKAKQLFPDLLLYIVKNSTNKDYNLILNKIKNTK